MQTQVVYPVDALSSWISDGLRAHTTSLLTVAYLDAAGTEALLDALRDRLRRPRAHVRILFQDHAFRTHPDAIRMLLAARRGRPGNLDVRYAGRALRKFHAKAYGFRTGQKKLEVIVGSSNATEKALGIDCGEMNVYLAERTAEAAWSVMEEYWSLGTDVDRAWLTKYSRAHARYERLAARANALVERWRGASERKPKARLWSSAISVEHTYPFTADERKDHDRRVNAAKADGVEVPGTFISMTSRKDAVTLSRRGEAALQVFWRHPSDVRRGIQSIAFFYPGAAQKIGNARLGQRWLVGVRYVRGTRIGLKRAHTERVARLLAKHGQSYARFESISGRLRSRRELMKKIYLGLRNLTASEKRGNGRR